MLLIWPGGMIRKLFYYLTFLIENIDLLVQRSERLPSVYFIEGNLVRGSSVSLTNLQCTLSVYLLTGGVFLDSGDCRFIIIKFSRSQTYALLVKHCGGLVHTSHKIWGSSHGIISLR